MPTITVHLSEDDVACLWANNWKAGKIQDIAASVLRDSAIRYLQAFPKTDVSKLVSEFRNQPDMPLDRKPEQNAFPFTNHMQSVGSAIAGVLPRNTGFFALVFNFNPAPGEKAAYVSNGSRKDVIRAMHEFLDRNPLPEPEKN